MIFECLNFFTSNEEESLKNQAFDNSEILSNAFFCATQAADVDEFPNITEGNDNQRLSKAKEDLNGQRATQKLSIQPMSTVHTVATF